MVNVYKFMAMGSMPPIDDGWKRVQRIEGYKQKPKSERPDDEPPHKPHVFAIVVNLLKKLFSYSSTKKKSAQVVSKKEIIENLVNFQASLQELIHEDKSHDPSYTQTLTVLWHNLTHDCNLLKSSLAKTDPILIKYKILLEEIDLYPPWEEHTLGYYLSKKAGKDWLPIPFMEILFALHADANKNLVNNTIEKWCRDITEIKDQL